MSAAVGRRTDVLREVTVEITLTEGEVGDMIRLYGTSVFAPRRVRISYVSQGGGAWGNGRVVVDGPQRLKSGSVSTERWHESDFWRLDHGLLPGWVVELVEAHRPTAVTDDDLPVQSEAVEL